VASIQGTNGKDNLLSSKDADLLNGMDGNDTYIFPIVWGKDSIIDSSGTDTVDMSALVAALNVNMASTTGNQVSDGSSTISWTGNSIENIITGAGRDTVNGSTGDNYISTGAGSDAIWAGLGNDTIDGGEGNDRYVYTGAWGNDSIIDSSGTDQLDFSTSTLNININLTSSNGNEVSSGQNTINWNDNVIENVLSGSGNDTISGNSGNNFLSAGAGNDTLNESTGNDTLDGGTGDDTYIFTNLTGKTFIADSGGNDTVNLSAYTTGFTVNLATGTAQPVPQFMPELKINTVAHSSIPSITTLSNGSKVVVWSSLSGVYGRYLDAMNNTIGTEFKISIDNVPENTIHQYDETMVTNLDDGGYLVVWRILYGTSRAGIFAQKYDALGNKSGTEFQIEKSPSLNQEIPFVTKLSGGGYLIAWQSKKLNEGSGVMDAQRFNVEGNLIGAQFTLSEDASLEVIKAAFAETSNGGFIATWISRHKNQGDFGLYAQRYDGNGNKLGPKIQVTQELVAVVTPSITTLSNGNFVVSWRGLVSYGQLFDSTGTAIGNNFAINPDTNVFPIATGLVSLPNGGFLSIWGDSDRSATYGQIFNASGAMVNDKFKINDITTSDVSLGQSVTTQPDGSFTVTWVSDISDIYVRSFNADGTPKLSNYNTISSSENAIENVLGTQGNDLLIGGIANNRFQGNQGNDTLDGGLGNDIYLYTDNWDQDSIRDASGLDTINLKAVTSSLNINLGYTPGDEITDGINNVNWTGNIIENIITGSGRDTVNGSISDNYISTGFGSDAIWAGLGNDTIDGGDGNDRYVYTGAWGTDSILDSSGTDQLDFSTATLNVNFNLDPSIDNKVTAGINIVKWTGDIIENVKAGSGNDNIIGNKADNILMGGGGNDTLNGGAGNDSLYGGNGNDVYQLSTGNITIDDSGDSDQMNLTDYNWAAGTVTINAADLLNKTGQAGADGLYDSLVLTIGQQTINIFNYFDNASGNISNISAGSGLIETFNFSDQSLDFKEIRENLNANSIAYSLRGNIDNNVLLGANGDDWLWGLSGNDTLLGGNGNDRLEPGYGNDIVQGGFGNDTYVIWRELQIGESNAIDSIYDENGNDDTLLFGGTSSGIVSDWQALDSNDDHLIDQLKIIFADNETLNIQNYFSNSSTSILQSQPGNGAVENIIFSGMNGFNETFHFNDVLTLTSTPNNLKPLSIQGTSGDDNLKGGLGNDTIQGMGGFDIIHGLAGNDMLTGGGETVQIYGDEGDDTLYGGIGVKADGVQETLDGGMGNDIIYAGNNYQWSFLSGGTGNDTLVGSDGLDSFIFRKGDGHDFIQNIASANQNDEIRIEGYIDPATIAFYMNHKTLEIGFTDTNADMLSVQNAANPLTNYYDVFIPIDEAHYKSIDVYTINQIVTEMSAYAVDHGIQLNSLNDVKQNSDLLSIIHSHIS